MFFPIPKWCYLENKKTFVIGKRHPEFDTFSVHKFGTSYGSLKERFEALQFTLQTGCARYVLDENQRKLPLPYRTRVVKEALVYENSLLGIRKSFGPRYYSTFGDRYNALILFLRSLNIPLGIKGSHLGLVGLPYFRFQMYYKLQKIDFVSETQFEEISKRFCIFCRRKTKRNAVTKVNGNWVSCCVLCFRKKDTDVSVNFS